MTQPRKTSGFVWWVRAYLAFCLANVAFDVWAIATGKSPVGIFIGTAAFCGLWALVALVVLWKEARS